MASDTKIDLRKQMIYSIFVRNYSPAGNFEGVQKDLDRIKDLGTDIIWLLPIQPSGKEKRKGAWVHTTQFPTIGLSTRNTGLWRTSSACAMTFTPRG